MMFCVLLSLMCCAITDDKIVMKMTMRIGNYLLIFGERFLSYELNDLLQVILLCEDLLGSVLQAGVALVIVGIEERLQHSHVLWVISIECSY